MNYQTETEKVAAEELQVGDIIVVNDQVAKIKSVARIEDEEGPGIEIQGNYFSLTVNPDVEIAREIEDES